VEKNSLIQVFANLFINSIHALPQGGDIELSLKEKDSVAHISIRDTGPGVPENLLEKVQEPLFTTKGAEGSGLGLAICKEIIEIDHQGEFKISNHPEGGLQIDILIPQVREA
jgi:signal transduction histidine kinase